MLRRRSGLLVLALPLVLAACSNGGSGANRALGLAPTPSVTASNAPSAASAAARATASATPTRTAGPTATHSASTSGTHSSSPMAKQTTKQTTKPPTPSPTKKPASTLTIYTNDYYFMPQNPTVPVGTKVTVMNPTTDSHTWTSGSNGIHTGPFNSGKLNYGQSYTYTFSQAGSYNFFCKYHYSSNNMKGHITVM
jgi:plastocyanin